MPRATASSISLRSTSAKRARKRASAPTHEAVHSVYERSVMQLPYISDGLMYSRIKLPRRDS